MDSSSRWCSAIRCRKSTAPETSNVIGGLIAVTVNDTDATVHLYHDVLGFKQLMSFPYMGDANRMAMGATPGAQYRSTVLEIPGTQVSIEFPQFKDIDRKPLHTRLQDPGTALVQLEVRNVDAVLKTLKAAGVEVVSVGGEPVEVPISSTVKLHIAIVRDPNNLFLELVQATNRRARSQVREPVRTFSGACGNFRANRGSAPCRCRRPA